MYIKKFFIVLHNVHTQFLLAIWYKNMPKITNSRIIDSIISPFNIWQQIR